MSLVKALIKDKSNQFKEFEVMFNPQEYTINKNLNYSPVTKIGSKKEAEDFTYKEEDTLNMDLFYDSSFSHLDVRDEIYKLEVLTIPSVKKDVSYTETNNKKESKKTVSKLVPPRLLFIWGSLVFDCYITSLTKKFSRFNLQGIPIRATVSVTFNGHYSKENQVEKSQQVIDTYPRMIIVKPGDTLTGLSYEHYNDQGFWKLIADENNIVNVRELEPGSQLTMPKI